MKGTKGKLIGILSVLVILAAAFWYGGGAPGLQGWSVGQRPTPQVQETPPSVTETAAATPSPMSTAPENPEDTQAPALPSAVETPAPSQTPAPSEPPASGLESRPGGLEGGMTAQEKIDAAAKIAGGSSAGVEKGSAEYSTSQGMVLDPSTGKDKYLTDPVPEGKPLPVEPEDAAISDTAYTCTLSISCATILNNIDWLDPEKVELVPEDGWILKPTTVTFYEGESVFNVLQRTCKQKKIHMEFENTPMYNSAYIEGINNLYEFDCGELSGWMYKVNEWFPNYGCSRYQLKDGDIVNWEYTCDLGVDVGGFYSTGG